MNQEIADLKVRARGRWREILIALGVDPKLLVNRHRPCPFCGGKDRYRWSDFRSDGWYYCNSCGQGDGFKLLHLYLREEYRKVFSMVRAYLDSGIMVIRDTAPPEDLKKREEALKIWKRCTPITPGDSPVTSYLINRGLRKFSHALHYGHCPDGGTNRPTMVAPVSDVTGELAGMHWTFLERNGKGWVKARIDQPKRQRKIAKTISGGAIRLYDPSDGMIGLAEGIETAIAAYQLTQIPTWAVMSTSGMTSFQTPEGIRKVMIFGDNDPNFAGQKAAYELANRLVLREQLEVRVRIPEPVGSDWLDILTQTTRRSA